MEQSTDSIRKPLVDKVDLTIYPDNPDAADQHLKAGDTDLEADGGVQATLQAQIAADPKLKANADNPATGFTRYLVVFQTVAPLTNVRLPQGDLLRDQQVRPAAGPWRYLRRRRSRPR